MRYVVFVISSAWVTSVLAASGPVVLEPAAGCRLECVEVPAGSYRQGSPAEEAGRGTDETERRVTLTKPFLLGRTPVTRAQFAAFARASGYRTEAERGKSGGFGVEGGRLVQRKGFDWRHPGFPQDDDHPVVIITFKDATSFCDWVARKTGRVCRLPSEAEWEYGCRAGVDSSAASGVALPSWHQGNSGGHTRAVTSLPANEFGLHDMPGQVGQWCLDWYAERTAEEVTDPLVTVPAPGDKARRVVRGGSFLRPEKAARPAARHRFDPGSRNADLGFRILVESPAELPVEETPVQAAPSLPVAPGTPSPVGGGDAAPARMPESAPAKAAVFPAAVAGGTSSFSLFPLLLLGIPFGLLVIIIGWISRRDDSEPRRHAARFPYGPGRREGASGFAPGAGAPRGIRITDTGFWLEASVARPGEQVHFRWEDSGGRHEEQVEFAPGINTGGHFVFTGRRPMRVEILSVRDLNPTGYHPASEPDPAPPAADGSAAGASAVLGGAVTGWAIGRSVTSRHSGSSRWPSAY